MEKKVSSITTRTKQDEGVSGKKPEGGKGKNQKPNIAREGQGYYLPWGARRGLLCER